MPMLLRLLMWSPTRRLIALLLGKRAGRMFLKRVPKKTLLRLAWRRLRL